MLPHVACRYRSAFHWRATNTSLDTHKHARTHTDVHTDSHIVPWRYPGQAPKLQTAQPVSQAGFVLFSVCVACCRMSRLVSYYHPSSSSPFSSHDPPTHLRPSLAPMWTHTHTQSQTSTHTHLCPLLDSASSQDCSTGTLHSLSCERRGEEGLGWGGQRCGWCPPQLFTSRQTSERMKVCAAGSRRGKTNSCRGKRDWRVDAARLSKYSHKNVWLPKNYFFLFWWTNKIMASIYK